MVQSKLSRDYTTQLDNTRVVRKYPIKFKLTEELKAELNRRKFEKLAKEKLAYIYDADKAKYYRNLLNFYNYNAFGYGISGNLTRFDPTTPEGQRAIEANYNYAKNNATNFMANIASTGAASTVSRAARKAGQVYSKVFKGPFKLASTRGSLGTLKLYTKNGIIGKGAEAVVVNNTPTTVGKITTIPAKEMAARNAIPNTVKSKYIGFVKDKGTKLPTYVLNKVKILTNETFPKYTSKLDKAMRNNGYRRVSDPNVLYRAYTNGTVVIDDIAPGNVGLNWFGNPKIIDFNLLTVPEWLSLGFKLKRGGKI